MSDKSLNEAVENVLIYTGERHMPEESSDEMVIEHTQRYLFAKEFVTGKIVLDAACGEGYGTAILGTVAKRAYGLDISLQAVRDANKKYGNETIEFKQGSIEKLPFENNSIDIIVSYETVEHVEASIQKNFLKEIKRVLKEDGILIISTPNKAIYTDKVGYKNEYHIKEFYLEDFKAYLENEFKNLSMFNQYFEVGYYLKKEGERPKECPKATPSDKARYYIAVCSNKAKKLEVEEDYTRFNNENYFTIMTHSHRVEQDAIQLNNDLKSFREESMAYIKHLEDDINALNQEIKGFQNEIKKLKSLIEHRDKDINILNQEIVVRDSKIQKVDKLMIELNRNIEHVNKELRQANEKINLLTTEIRDRDNEIQQMSELNEKNSAIILQQNIELERIKAHWMYKIVNKLNRRK